MRNGSLIETDRHTTAATIERPARSTEPTGRTPFENSTGGLTRRTVVRTAAMATGTLLAGAGLSTTVAAQAVTFELGGEVGGWQGRSPSSIGGQTNPTLELEAGTEYEITWENVDGAPHNVVIEDAEGNDLVRTEIVSGQGATQSVTFTASEEMTTYLCEVHPQSMRGDVSVSGSGGGGGTDTPETTATGTATEAPTETATETETETATATDTPTGTATGTPSDDDGPLMADEACPEEGTQPTHSDTCAKGRGENGDHGRRDDDFGRLIELLIRLLRRLLGGW